MTKASWALLAALCLSLRRRAARWLPGAVIYEVFPRDFSPAGDFNGVTAGLDRLQQLGVDVVWLMPIHPIGQVKRKGTLGSPYSVRDYYAINPDYGTKDDLKRLVAEAHRRGMRVIIDIVANHTSWDSVMMQTPEFYKHNAAGQIIPPVPDWEDVAALDYSNPRLRAYMIDMLRYWIRDFDLDGFRCDAANMVPVSFWESARAELDKLKPGILMLAEAHDPPLMAKAFDLDYAWPLHSALAAIFSKGAPARDLRAAWEEERAQYPKGALHMRISDDHDEERAIVRFGKGGALAASAFMFTLDGVPLLYEGMEVGDTAESGAPALFEKLPVFWKIAERRPEFPRFYCRHDRAAPRASGSAAGRDGVAAQFRRRAHRDVPAQRWRRGIPGGDQLLEPAVPGAGGHRRGRLHGGHARREARRGLRAAVARAGCLGLPDFPQEPVG
jgi:cyclomaltodextrinase